MKTLWRTGSSSSPFQRSLRSLPVVALAPAPPALLRFALGEADGEVVDVNHQARGAGIGDPFGRLVMGETLEDASEEMLNIGPLARAAAELDEPTRTNIRDAVAGALAPYQTSSGVKLPAAVWLVSARG